MKFHLFPRLKASNRTQQRSRSQSLSKIPHAITRYLRERLSTKYLKGNHSSVMPVRQVETGVNIFIDRCPFPRWETGTRNRVSPIYVSQLTKINKRRKEINATSPYFSARKISQFSHGATFPRLRNGNQEGHPRRNGLMTVPKESKPRFLSTVLR